MEAQALPQQRPFPWRRAVAAVAVLLVAALVGTGIGLYVWLARYEPLGIAGSYLTAAHPGHMVESPQGSGGLEVFFPRYRPRGTFEAVTTFANHAPFPITVLGLGRHGLDPSPFRAVQLQVARRDYDTRQLEPLDRSHPLRLKPGEDRTIVLTYRFFSRCLGGQPAGYWKQPGGGAGDVGFRSTWFRIRYEHVFEKTQSMQLPFAISLICKNGITSPSG